MSRLGDELPDGIRRVLRWGVGLRRDLELRAEAVELGGDGARAGPRFENGWHVFRVGDAPCREQGPWSRRSNEQLVTGVFPISGGPRSGDGEPS